MSAFGIGTNVAQTSAGEIQGRQINIACKTWFTANGSASPLSIKFEGDDGIIQSISDICVLCSEDKNYSGIASKEFSCKAIIGGLMHEFKLVFYLEESRWVMIL